MEINSIKIEEWQDNQPHKGKIFAAVFPHSDDFTFFAAGLIMKMVYEGYEGYFIRLTNDEKDSYDLSIGETIYNIEKETEAAAKVIGIKKVYNFNYKNHYLQHSQMHELRHRLITLFRFLKVDTVISFDPWGHYEENPDHYLTGMAVEQSCWMAGRQLDLPELKDMGIYPHFVTEKYYVARGPQLVNRIIDISPVLERKAQSVRCHKTPIENMWKVYLEKHPNESEYSGVDEFVEDNFINVKCTPICGLTCYEKYHYIPPEKY